MKNEIGRKITSLTLMTIMVAGGLTFAIPGVMPDAYAAVVQSNPHLYVSAEGQDSQNEVGPGNVIEVVIIDPLISDTDEGKGEPDVQVNGQDLRMVQATDGAWYAYVADTDSAVALDKANMDAGVAAGLGLDFGQFCTAATGSLFLGIDVSDTQGVAINTEGDGTDGALGACAGTFGGPNGTINVIREPESPNNPGVGGVTNGQIALGLGNGTWPFIQLFDFAEDGAIEFVYNRAGGTETVSLLFDDPSEDISLDREKYSPNSFVFFTVMDQALNVDPTDEDTFVIETKAGSQAMRYLLLDENGKPEGLADGPLNTALDLYSITVVDVESSPFDERITINRGAQGTDILDCRSNEDFPTTLTTTGECIITGGTVPSATFPIALVESGANTAKFVNWSEDNKANLVIDPKAPRGLTAEVEYEDPGFVSILTALSFGSITLDTASLNGEWNSGERLGLTLTDADANKNSLIDEDLDVNNPRRLLIPSLRIGTPFTLGSESTGDSSFGAVKSEWVGDAVPLLGVNLKMFASVPLVAPANGNVTFTNQDISAEDNEVQAFSDRYMLNPDNVAPVDGNSIVLDSGSALYVDVGQTASGLYDAISKPTEVDGFLGHNFLNYDLRSLEDVTNMTVDDIMLVNQSAPATLGKLIDATAITLVTGAGSQGLANVTTDIGVTIADPANTRNDALFSIDPTDRIGYLINFTGPAKGGFDAGKFNNTIPIVIDFFSFGLDDRGQGSTRVNNAIYRVEAEETGKNTSSFEGTVEYLMTNQLNVLSQDTYSDLRPIDSDILFVITEDFTDEDAPRFNYLDLGADGVSTQIGVQEDAPSHSGIVSFDGNTYKVADTVTITLEDPDLNTDNDIIDIFTTVSPVTFTGDPAADTIGAAGLGTYDDGTAFGRLLDITFDDELWTSGLAANGGACGATPGSPDDGLAATGATLVETSKSSGVLKLDFQVPSTYCQSGTGTLKSVTGTDIEVNYVDFRDASGEIVEVGDSAGIRANTGSVSLDRTVYPVPFSKSAATSGSNFPLHATAGAGTFLGDGTLTIHVRVNDPDFDVSASGEDKIATLGVTNGPIAGVHGPVKITVSRGANDLVLATAGGPVKAGGVITIGEDVDPATRALGPIDEIAPDAGIFELDLDILWSDGPASTKCPTTTTYTTLGGAGPDPEDVRFGGAAADPAVEKFCILQGDILTVEYEDPTDASGDPNTVTDSATFDLRNGVLQSDKSVYIIGSDMILTLIEPDLDLDNDGAETWDLDLIEWDSDAATVSMGDLGGSAAAFDPEPSNFRETGDSTGIFQIVIEIPAVLVGDKLERGEEIVLEYTDWGPSGADYVGDEDEDVNLTIFTSNFGATIELDQKVYTWTDKVYITIVAPDHNFDSDLIDEIGDTTSDPIRIATRGNDIDNYKLVETGTDTGIFTGEVILTGFKHDADGDLTTGDATGFDTDPKTSPDFSGPTDGFLASSDDDGITVSFEFSEDETVVGSALVRWNIGETQWLEASYPAKGTGVVRIVDPDMNLNPESVDNFQVDVWSDSDSGGIDLTVTETNEATGIFEGTVFFTTTDQSSGHRLRVAEGDTVTAEYEDNTLPDPYTTADELDITGTALIGTVVPPLERAPATNCRIVDAFGNSLTGVAADQQVQIVCDLSNGQDRDQDFAYLVQLQDANGVTQALSWITGTLAPGQSFSPSQSWTPELTGGFDVTVFVWESVDNPTALSPPVSIPANVQ